MNHQEVTPVEKNTEEYPSVLIAASIYPPNPGGPAMHAKELYGYLTKNGYLVQRVVLSHFLKLPKGIRHIVFASKLLALAVNTSILYTYDALGAGIPTFFVSRILGKKYILRIGGDILWEREAEQYNTKLSMYEWYTESYHKKSFLFYVSKIVIQGADVIIVPSVQLQKLYEKYYQVDLKRIIVIPNPITLHTESIVPKTLRTIVFASRLVAYKNLSFVLQSLARIVPHAEDIEFLIMGDGPERILLEQEVKELGISHYIRFTGSISQDEVIKNTATCMFALAPALTEFNPNYILECIGFGKPFLISREHGLPFVVPDECVFNPRNHTEFEEKLSTLLTPEGYSIVQKKVSEIHFHMSWADVLKKNEEIITTLSHS